MMEHIRWTVELVEQAKKAFRELPKYTANTLRLLIEDLELNGYQRYNWPNFSKLKDSLYHCHLEKGRPTYVACWRVYKNKNLIEVYYAGTHEKAPY
jgi:phage-related protein